MGKKHGCKYNYFIEYRAKDWNRWNTVTFPISDIKYCTCSNINSSNHVWCSVGTGYIGEFTVFGGEARPQTVRFLYKDKLLKDINFQNASIEQCKQELFPLLKTLVDYYQGLEKLEHL